MTRTAVILALLAALASGAALADAEEPDPGVARDPDYAAGRQAAQRKDWNEAAGHYAKVALRHPGNADVHNELGYAYRNQRRYDLAFEHYKRALAIDPRHKGAHEYIGEAYLQTGDLASAGKHLAALKKLCPLSCEQLEDLQREVDAYRKKGATGSKP